MPSKAQRRNAIKYGRIKERRPLGHGGARGNGSHLSSNRSETSERSRREEAKTLKLMGRKA